MDWLAERADWRADPRKLWPEVRSIVMLGMNYGPESSTGFAAEIGGKHFRLRPPSRLS